VGSSCDATATHNGNAKPTRQLKRRRHRTVITGSQVELELTAGHSRLPLRRRRLHRLGRGSAVKYCLGKESLQHLSRSDTSKDEPLHTNLLMSADVLLKTRARIKGRWPFCPASKARTLDGVGVTAKLAAVVLEDKTELPHFL